MVLYLLGCFSSPSFWTTQWEALTGPQGPPCATGIVLLLHIAQQLYSFPPELRPVLLADNSPLAAGSGARRGQGDRLHCQFESESVSHLFVTPKDCSLPGSSVHGISPGKNTGVGCHFLCQGIFPTQESNPCLLRLLQWQDSLPSEPPGKPHRQEIEYIKSGDSREKGTKIKK